MKTGEGWTVCFRGRRAKAGLGGTGRRLEQRTTWNQNLPTCEVTAVRRRPPLAPCPASRHVPAHASPAAALKPQQSR